MLCLLWKALDCNSTHCSSIGACVMLSMSDAGLHQGSIRYSHIKVISRLAVKLREYRTKSPVLLHLLSFGTKSVQEPTALPPANAWK